MGKPSPEEVFAKELEEADAEQQAKSKKKSPPRERRRIDRRKNKGKSDSSSTDEDKKGSEKKQKEGKRSKSRSKSRSPKSAVGSDEGRMQEQTAAQKAKAMLGEMTSDEENKLFVPKIVEPESQQK